MNAGFAVQMLAPTVKVSYFGGHVLQESDPTPSWYCPNEHAVQLLLPFTGANIPGLHFAHSHPMAKIVAALNLPFAQPLQSVIGSSCCRGSSPSSSRYFPTPHARHSLSALPLELKVAIPAGHVVHVPALSRLQRPPLHTIQCSSVECCVAFVASSGRYFPAVQLRQTVAAFPATHCPWTHVAHATVDIAEN